MTTDITAQIVAMLTIPTGAAALALLVPYLVRLYQTRWRSHLWRVVGMHLAWALWIGSVAFDALVEGTMGAAQPLGVLGAALWLAVSWRDWRHGPPRETETAPSPLGAAETVHAPLAE